MNNIEIFGISNCDTVRKAKKWLQESEIEFKFCDFRVDGLSEEQIKTWLTSLPLETLFNKRSTSFRNLSDDQKSNIDEAKAIKLMLEHPTLIKRPVLIVNNQAHVGFKKEQYQEIFNS